MSIDDYRYYVVFVDDHSRFTWFYPLKAKSDFYAILTVFLKFVQTQFSRKVKIFQSDGGKEFVNHAVKKLFDGNGTFHRISCSYTPQQNGQAERKHQTIMETGLAMLFNSNVSTSYWVEAFSSATYIFNRLPSSVLNGKTPFEILYSRMPNYSNFRVFGCRVFPYLRDYAPHKLSPRSIPCVFISYSSQYKGYRFLDLQTSRIYITRPARFAKDYFPFK